MKRIGIIFALLFLPANLFGWGPAGHRIVARIAQANLRNSTRLQVRDLLGDDDLAGISVWADEIKMQRPETASWHFVDIPGNSTGFNEARDCYRPNSNEKNYQASIDRHNCVVDRIQMSAAILAEKSASHSDRAEALKFLVHFVADIHQPLHAIADSRGGNDIHVFEFGSSQCGKYPCNLHFVWDIGLIAHSGRSESEYVALLQRQVALQHLRSRSDGTPEEWANESFRLAKQVWLNDGAMVDEAYYRKNIDILEKRLALAGLRLAALLNDVLDRPAHRADREHEHHAAKK